MNKNISATKSNDFSHSFSLISGFLNHILCKEEIGDDLYVHGSRRIKSLALRNREKSNFIVEEIPHGGFEETLFQDLCSVEKSNLVIYFGGLGAGKTTTVKYILRRFEERSVELREKYVCSSNPCVRKPIYLEFSNLVDTDRDRAINDVFHRLRLAIFRRLIEEWLDVSGNNVSIIEAEDPKFLVLRRVLIANDLVRFHGNNYPELAALWSDELALENDDLLYNLRFSDTGLIEKIKLWRRAAQQYESVISRFRDDPENSKTFIILALKFLLSKCSQANPLNLIVIDNLDQLLTPTIDAIIKRLYDIAHQTTYLPLLVPLRPSSISPTGYVSDTQPKDHYGPNNFQMIKERLEKFVLTRSRTELAQPRSESNSLPFSHAPSEQELDMLLVVSYIYAKIMNVGVSLTSSERPTIKLHEDHKFLERIYIGERTLDGLALTVDAFVGVCCRYALNVLKRFFANCYSEARMIYEAKKQRRNALEHGLTTTFGYSILVYCLLSDAAPGLSREERVANLFEPIPRGRHHGWPTMTKLRILGMLVRNRTRKVNQVLERLELYGIPREVTIEAINSLQDKYRLLIWCSTNEKLRLDDRQHLEADIVVSEHGDEYFKRVVGDFEYLWYCATTLKHIKYQNSPKLTAKLSNYESMIRNLGETEWKQITFYRLRSDCIASSTGIEASAMDVLGILYSSLARALQGSSIAIAKTEDDNKLVNDFKKHVIDICKLLKLWQKNYQIAFGSNFYLTIFEDQISNLQNEMLTIQKNYKTSIVEIENELKELQESWLEDEGPINLISMETESEFSDLEKRILDRFNSGRLSWAQPLLKNYESSEPASIFICRYIDRREKCIHILSNRLPTFSEASMQFKYMEEDLEGITCNSNGAASTDLQTRYRWCLTELQFLREEVNEKMEKNKYDVPVECDKEKMTELKSKHNEILSCIEKVARRLGVINTEHLKLRWS